MQWSMSVYRNQRRKFEILITSRKKNKLKKQTNKKERKKTIRANKRSFFLAFSVITVHVFQ